MPRPPKAKFTGPQVDATAVPLHPSSLILQSGASPQVVSEAKDNGSIYDPACGSGGVAKCEVRIASVEVKKTRPFVIRKSAFAIPPADIGKEQADIRHVQHPDPARRDADFVLANPPFNDSDRFRNQTFHA